MYYKPRVLDLFCGAGGLSLGFQRAGCKILGGIDLEKWPVETHHRNFPDCQVKLDPVDISIVEPASLGLPQDGVDILIGGPPCQGFSQVGRAKIRSLGQHVEKRRKNRLYRQFIRFLDHFQPLYFVIENVNGMSGVGNRRVFNDALRELSGGLDGTGYRNGIRYEVSHRVLRASAYGVPQHRYRLFIIGRRSDCPDLKVTFPDPLDSEPVTLHDAISDLRCLRAPVLVPKIKGSLSNGGVIQENKIKTYWHEPRNPYQELIRDGQTAVFNHQCRGHNKKDLEIFALLKQGQKYKDLPQELMRYRADIFDDKYRRLKFNDPSPTVTAHMQKDTLAFIHPTQTRSISAREAARIQSFPDSFVFEGPLTKVFRMIGNAVPPLLAQCVAEQLVIQVRSRQIGLKNSTEKQSEVV